MSEADKLRFPVSLEQYKRLRFERLGEKLHSETTSLVDLTLTTVKPILDAVNKRRLRRKGTVVVQAPFVLDRDLIGRPSIWDIDEARRMALRFEHTNFVLASLRWGDRQDASRWRKNPETKKRKVFRYSFPENSIFVVSATNHGRPIVYLPNVNKGYEPTRESGHPDMADILNQDIQEMMDAGDKLQTKRLSIDFLNIVSSSGKFIRPVTNIERVSHMNSQGREYEEFKSPFYGPVTVSNSFTGESLTIDNPNPRMASTLLYIDMFGSSLEEQEG